jgi:hypothetical protein
VADGGKHPPRAIGSDVAALLVLKVPRAIGPWPARITRDRYKQRSATVNAEHVVGRVCMVRIHDVATLDVALTRCLITAAQSLSDLDAREVRRVLVNECVLHGNLAKEMGSLAMGRGTKKADVVECCKTFDHAGLLVNRPPGSAGLPFI